MNLSHIGAAALIVRDATKVDAAFLNDGAMMALAVEDRLVTGKAYGAGDTFTMGIEEFGRDLVEAEPQEYWAA